MPWKTLKAVHPSVKKHQGARLTLAQANEWARYYDQAKAQGFSESRAAAMAWGRWTKRHKKVGDRWVKKASYEISFEEAIS